MITMNAGLVGMNSEHRLTIYDFRSGGYRMERKNSAPRKNSSGKNGLISFSGESAEKPAKQKKGINRNTHKHNNQKTHSGLVPESPGTPLCLTRKEIPRSSRGMTLLL
jgi:hypothetical protein